MMKFLKILGVFLLSAKVVWAHAPDEIRYVFDQDEQGGILTIHLTTQGAIDLLTRYKPALADESIIKLKSYYGELTSYFNETIHLTINGKDTRFTFVQGDLVSHDATLVYRLDDNVEYQGKFEVSISSFIEIYPRVHNYVTIVLPTGEKQWVLDANKKSCSMSLPQSKSEARLITHPPEDQMGDVSTIYFLMGSLLAVVGIVSAFVYFKKCMQKRVTH